MIQREIAEQENLVVIAGLNALRQRPKAGFRLARRRLEISSAYPGNEDSVWLPKFLYEVSNVMPSWPELQMAGRQETVPGIATEKRFSALPRSSWR